MYEADTRYIDQMGFMFLAAIQPTLEREVVRLLMYVPCVSYI